MRFVESVKLFFRHYVNFSGRSRRSEYWWAWLFCLIVSLFFVVFLPDIAGFWELLILIPSTSLTVRRLHDIGKSGWWYLVSIIPLVGAILLLAWCCRDSQYDSNQWGQSPKY